MALPRLAVGSALLGAAAIVAAGNFDPGSGFASAGVRLARASFEGPVNADVVHVVDGGIGDEEVAEDFVHPQPRRFEEERSAQAGGDRQPDGPRVEPRLSSEIRHVQPAL